MAKRSVKKKRRRERARRERLASLPNIAPETEFHIRRNGNVEPCRKPEGVCLLGKDTIHYDTYDEAKEKATKMISSNPEIAEIPEAPYEGLFYQELIDPFGETKGWFSTYNGDLVSDIDLEQMKEEGLTYKEFINKWDVGLTTGQYSLLVDEAAEEEFVDARFALAIDGSVVFDKETKIEYRIHSKLNEDEEGKYSVEYLSIDAYENGLWTEEHSSYLPEGSFVDRQAKPWSIVDN